MIQSYLIGPTLLSSNSSPIAFEMDCVRTRSAYPCNGWLCHSQGSPLYKINKGGNYRVTFNGNISSDATGLVSLALFMDGVEVPGTRVQTQITTAGIYNNVAFDKIVPICCCGDGALTVQSVPSVISGVTGSEAAVATQIPTIQNANLTITKLS